MGRSEAGAGSRVPGRYTETRVRVDRARATSGDRGGTPRQVRTTRPVTAAIGSQHLTRWARRSVASRPETMNVAFRIPLATGTRVRAQADTYDTFLDGFASSSSLFGDLSYVARGGAVRLSVGLPRKQMESLSLRLLADSGQANC